MHKLTLSQLLESAEKYPYERIYTNNIHFIELSALQKYCSRYEDVPYDMPKEYVDLIQDVKANSAYVTRSVLCDEIIKLLFTKVCMVPLGWRSL